MANYPQELAQDAVCQSHTGHMTGLWFLNTTNTNGDKVYTRQFWKSFDSDY